MRTYYDLIEQTFHFPTKEFDVKEKGLHFHNIPLMDMINLYGTPLKITYLPKISENINYVIDLFNDSIKKHQYPGRYAYCYCTKSSHFKFVMDEVLKNKTHIETSSHFDMKIVDRLLDEGKVDPNTLIICNGYKPESYKQAIVNGIEQQATYTIPVLDNTDELDFYEQKLDGPFDIGLRVATEEEPNFVLYTSRLGIRYNDILAFYKQRIRNNPKINLKLIHFFINTGIKDTSYYWDELTRFIEMYCELKQVCPELEAIDLGGGFPVKNSLHFEYDYAYMVDQIIKTISEICDEFGVQKPDLITEFGSYTVGESGAIIYSVMGQKWQNDRELWYMIDGSLITQIPDIWGLDTKFIMLAINQWNNRHQRINIGGLTCDSMDFYNSEAHNYEVFLPQISKHEPLYLGFFHTGAYQEALGGYMGVQHCLIPSPQHVIIDENENGTFHSWLYAKEQSSEVMLNHLGY